MLAYNCSPSFNWKKNLDDSTIARFQNELGAMGYNSSSSRWPGSIRSITRCPSGHGTLAIKRSAFVELQQAEFAAADKDLRRSSTNARGHRYFDAVTTTIDASRRPQHSRFH